MEKSTCVLESFLYSPIIV